MKKSSWMKSVSFVMLLGCLSPSSWASVPSKTYVAAGSGVNLGITQILATAFMEKHPDVEITVPKSIGTKGAIMAVADNTITFGLISRPLKSQEESSDYTVIAYATSPIVVGVNLSVKNEEITSQELVDIYKGTKTHWKNGEEIIVQIREAFDSGFEVLEKKIKGLKEACEEARKEKKWSTYFTDQEANHALAFTKNAIGVTDMGMISTENLAIKPLKLDGVAPSPATILSGEYPLTRTLYILYRDKTLPAEAREFLEFIRSAEAASLLKSHGYLAIALPVSP